MFNLLKTKIPTESGPVTIETITCQPLHDAGFINGFSTRGGGVSPLPSNDLNLAFKDDPDVNVKENRKRFLKSLKTSDFAIQTVKQTHSDTFFSVSSDEKFPTNEFEADSIQTNHISTFIGVKTADCLPLLLADPKTGWMAAIHAGWKGTLQRITEKSVNHLLQSHGVNAQDCLVAMGPHATVDHYEIGQEVYDSFRKEFEQGPEFFTLNQQSGKHHFDAAKANRMQLLKTGISEENIFQAPFCTIKQNDLFFSYRKEGKRPMGRLLSVIGQSSDKHQTDLK